MVSRKIALSAVALSLAAPIVFGKRPAAAAPAGATTAPVQERVLDTRRIGNQRFAAGESRPLAEVAPAVADTVGYAVNLTIVDPSSAGFATVQPCSQQPGVTSTLNFVAGQTVANAVSIVPATNLTGVCVYSSAAAHVIVDLMMTYRPGQVGAPVARAAQRLLDTRGTGGAPRTAAQTPVTIPVPGSPTIVGMSVIITNPVAAGFAAVHPCGAVTLPTSTVNFGRGETVANLALVRADAPLCITTSVAAHQVIDLVAVQQPTATIDASPPRRLLDTRDQVAWVAANATVRLSVGTTRSAHLNLTAVDPLAGGFVTVWPCNETFPTASALSWSRPQTVATAVIARADTAGEICIRPNVGTHIVIDLVGFDVAPPATVPVTISQRSNEWVIGRSVQGRPITARVYGSPSGPPVLGVGVIHGNEEAGLAIVARLKAATVPTGKQMWLIDSVNPDGEVLNRRGNAKGIDLNRNFPTNWAVIPPGANYSGPAPVSEPETAAVLGFLERVRPVAAAWWHQVGDYVDDNRKSVDRPDLLEQYVAAAAIGFNTAPCRGVCGGTATQHMNATLSPSSAFVVELPSTLSSAAAQRHANGFLALIAAV